MGVTAKLPPTPYVFSVLHLSHGVPSDRQLVVNIELGIFCPDKQTEVLWLHRRPICHQDAWAAVQVAVCSYYFHPRPWGRIQVERGPAYRPLSGVPQKMVLTSYMC